MNALFLLSVCAVAGLVSAAHSSAGPKFWVRTTTDKEVTPCKEDLTDWRSKNDCFTLYEQEDHAGHDHDAGGDDDEDPLGKYMKIGSDGSYAIKHDECYVVGPSYRVAGGDGAYKWVGGMDGVSTETAKVKAFKDANITIYAAMKFTKANCNENKATIEIHDTKDCSGTAKTTLVQNVGKIMTNDKAPKWGAGDYPKVCTWNEADSDTAGACNFDDRQQKVMPWKVDDHYCEAADDHDHDHDKDKDKKTAGTTTAAPAAVALGLLAASMFALRN